MDRKPREALGLLDFEVQQHPHDIVKLVVGVDVLGDELQRVVERGVRSMTVVVLVSIVVLVIVTVKVSVRFLCRGVRQRQMPSGPEMLFVRQMEGHVQQANSEREQEQEAD